MLCPPSNRRFVPKADLRDHYPECLLFGPCVDGSGLARDFFTFAGVGRSSHVFGLCARYS